MKILITSQHFYPDNFLVNDIAAALAEEGNDVTVLTGLPNYSTGRFPDAYLAEEKRDEMVGKVRVLRCKVHERRDNVLHRAWNYVSFAWHSVTLAKKLPSDYDIIFSYQTSPVSMARAAIVKGKRDKLPVLLYCLDLWPEAVKAWGLTERNPIYRIIKNYSGKIYRGATHVAVSSKPFIQYLETVHGMDPKKISYLPQHANDMGAGLGKLHKDEHTVRFVYAGNIGAVQMVDQIVMASAELVKLLPESKWEVHIFGDGSEFVNVKKLASNSSLDERLVFHGRIPADDLKIHYANADVFLLTLQHDNAIGDTLPAKLQGYMSAGKPILAMAGGATEEVINEAQCGTAVAPGNYLALASAMKSYVSEKSSHANEGQNSRYFYENFYTINKYIASLYSLIDMTIEENTN